MKSYEFQKLMFVQGLVKNGNPSKVGSLSMERLTLMMYLKKQVDGAGAKISSLDR